MRRRGGMADLMFTDRRINFDRCRYWMVDEEEETRNKLEYLEDEPSGYFNASPYSPINKDKNIVGGTFMFDEETTAITTKDDMSDLKKNDVVEFRGEVYRVQNIQQRPIRKNNQYSDDIGYGYLIYLKR